MRDLPRQLAAVELSDLFESDPIAAELEQPLVNARAFLASLPEKEQIAALNAHPPIGAWRGVSGSVCE